MKTYKKGFLPNLSLAEHAALTIRNVNSWSVPVITPYKVADLGVTLLSPFTIVFTICRV